MTMAWHLAFRGRTQVHAVSALWTRPRRGGHPRWPTYPRSGIAFAEVSRNTG